MKTILSVATADRYYYPYLHYHNKRLIHKD